jgi:hypothetical protein
VRPERIARKAGTKIGKKIGAARLWRKIPHLRDSDVRRASRA